MAIDAGGTSQRLNPGRAMILSFEKNEEKRETDFWLLVAICDGLVVKVICL